MIARWQLVELGFSAAAIRHRIETGRLHPLYRGVYAVGRPEVSRHGRWMAAVLRCGPSAVLSHRSAAVLWGIRRELRTGNGPPQVVEISVSVAVARNPPRIRVHRRSNLTEADVTTHHGIPVTTPASTLVDLASDLPRSGLEAAINEADKLDLIDPETLRVSLEAMPRRSGLGGLRRILDRHTFTLTDSALERLFLPLVRKAGLPPPLTQQRVNGYRVDFFWPELGLVVETDGLRYHRTPAQQTADHRRDHAHAAAGLERLRFSRAQVRYEPDHVLATLTRVSNRLRAPRGRSD